MRRRGARAGLGVALALLAVALGAVPAGAQTPKTIPAAVRCAQTKPTVVLIGTVRRIRDDTVTFDVDRLTQGEGADGTSVDVVYPSEFNARKLELLGSYRVAAVRIRDELRSVVPTAQVRACGQSTRHADGRAIDTSSLAGVKRLLPGLAAKAAVVVAGALLVLLLLGRLFDRKSRYRPWQRPTWRRQ